VLKLLAQTRGCTKRVSKDYHGFPMPIQFECSACGRKIKAPDENAGKKARCPYCQTVIVVPEPVYEAEDASAPPVGQQDAYGVQAAPSPSPKQEERRPCPMCGEMILADAVKCRYCGEIFDEDLKRAAKRSGGGRGGYADTDLAGIDWVLAILCSDIGCIVSVIYMIQGKPKGLKMFGLTWLFFFIRIIIVVGIQAAARH
jgi:predicted RNA-binding Zn-ribbon protein involved in translation (DUF1610 family)